MNRNGVPPHHFACFGAGPSRPRIPGTQREGAERMNEIKTNATQVCSTYHIQKWWTNSFRAKAGTPGSSAFWRTTALSARWPCSGLPWRWRERGIRVRFRRGSLRNGYHFYGGQQARKLPNAEKRVRQWKEIGLLDTIRCLGDSNGEYLNPLNIE